MRWESIEAPWRHTLELAWESFKKNSLPIAAVIVNTEGRIISTGRNQMLEKTMKNRKMAHAEMNALMNLPYDEHPEIRKYTLYTTTEPCPMCMGSIVMSDLRKVRIAMADPWAGAVDMCTLPYIASKKIDISFVGGVVEKVTIVMSAYRELEMSKGNLNPVAQRLKEHVPVEFAVGEGLFSKGTLRDYAQKDFDFIKAYDAIMSA